MSVRQYKQDNQSFFEVRLRVQDKQGNWTEKRKRGLKSLKQARKWEQNLFKGIGAGRIQVGNLKWQEWHKYFLETIKLSMKNSTVMGYDGGLKKWLPIDWREKKLKDFSKRDIHSFLFEFLDDRVTDHMRKELRKKLNRIFQSAVEEGLINRNPVLGIKVTVPVSEKKVLSSEE